MNQPFTHLSDLYMYLFAFHYEVVGVYGLPECGGRFPELRLDMELLLGLEVRVFLERSLVATVLLGLIGTAARMLLTPFG